MMRINLIINIFEIIETMKDKNASIFKFKIENLVMLKNDENYKKKKKERTREINKK